MTTTYSQGSWQVAAEERERFIKAWGEFASWTSTMPGAGALRLTRDLENPQRFMSFGEWQSVEAMHAWKGHPDFRENMSRVMAHVEELHRHELELLVVARDGTAESPGA